LVEAAVLEKLPKKIEFLCPDEWSERYIQNSTWLASATGLHPLHAFPGKRILLLILWWWIHMDKLCGCVGDETENGKPCLAC
jgi:hypothetical protein